MQADSCPAIRRATAADAGVLANLGRATFVETFGHLYAAADLDDFLAEAHSVALYDEILNDDDVAAWLAEDARGEPCGYVIAGDCRLPVSNIEANAGEIWRLYLRAQAQRSGLGTRLLTTALDWLDGQLRDPLYVGVWCGNTGAQRLYRRFGFEKVGEYEFLVGRHRDHEFILRRKPVHGQDRQPLPG
jgi:ribosomal protein S18 acetylase RimI-like enzyme